MESALRISPASRRARARARSLLPEAVGPTIRSRGGEERGAPPMHISVRPGQLDAGVVVPEDVAVARPPDGHAVGSHLAHPNAVAPSLAAENHPPELAVRPALPVDGEEALLQAEGGANVEAGQERLPLVADDPQRHHPTRHSPPLGNEVADLTHVEPRGELLRQLAGRQ